MQYETKITATKAGKAGRAEEKLRVYERIYDHKSASSWTDASSWYWNAAFGRGSGPWWAVTIAESLTEPSFSSNPAIVRPVN